jgi:AraC family transcriptional regulator
MLDQTNLYQPIFKGQSNQTNNTISPLPLQPTIKTLSEKRFVGKHLTMTFSNNQTFKLWQSFMPRRREITNNLTTELFSIQVYPPTFDFTFFNPNTEFEKWAAIEVADFYTVPNEMETYSLSGGLYAVFFYKGLNTDTKLFQYIFGTWLPCSNYLIDNRPHFEIIGEKYKNNDSTSEEEIWIPIKPKAQ